MHGPKNESRQVFHVGLKSRYTVVIIRFSRSAVVALSIIRIMCRVLNDYQITSDELQIFYTITNFNHHNIIIIGSYNSNKLYLVWIKFQFNYVWFPTMHFRRGHSASKLTTVKTNSRTPFLPSTICSYYSSCSICFLDPLQRTCVQFYTWHTIFLDILDLYQKSYRTYSSMFYFISGVLVYTRVEKSSIARCWSLESYHTHGITLIRRNHVSLSKWLQELSDRQCKHHAMWFPPLFLVHTK